jgi:micrococcal nuclease
MAVLLAVGACASPNPGAVPSSRGDASPSAGSRYRVTKVTDGDTIHVVYEGRDQSVRLIGVDAPEVDWYGGRAECFGSEADLYTRRRLEHATVRLAFAADRYDRYGRLLAFVYVGGEMFNLTLVERGYATADPVPPDIRMAATLASAEAAARSAGRGLWSACTGSP